MVTSEPLQYANGVLVVDDGKTLLVNDLYEGTTNIYEVDPYTKDLTLERKVVRSLRKELATGHEDPLTPANTDSRGWEEHPIIWLKYLPTEILWSQVTHTPDIHDFDTMG